ncbi:MAG: BatD family protein, partial [Ginsengibacter sp.]
PTEPTVHRFDDYILKKGDNVSEKVQKNLFIKLDVNKTSCYVGEPIVASYKLYTRLRSESTITNAPSFNGFSVSELEVNDNNSSSVEKYNGREYNVYTLRKVQLYPLQPGTVTLDPLIADNKVTFIKAEYAGEQRGDMFDDMMQNFADATTPADAVVEQHVTLKSKPVEITIKPLPEENKPADFKGAVGNFTLKSSVQKNNITTDDAGNLKIIIEGSGNIQLINAPKINWPEGLDGYDAKVSDDINKFSVPMKGSKTFTYPFTVSKVGTYTIPSISLSFFDPVSQTYKSLSTEPLVVTVTKGKGNSHGSFFKSLTTKSNGQVSIFKEYALYFIAAIFLIGGIVFWIFRKNIANKKNLTVTTPRNYTSKKDTRKNFENKIEKPEPEFLIPENPLQEAHEKLMDENSVGFYSVLHASLKKYLALKLKVPAEDLTKKRLNEELDKYNVGLGTSLMLSSLIDEVELNLYAPPSNANHLKDVYEKASEVVSLLNKQVI